VGQVGVLDKVMAILHAFPDGAARLQPPEIAEQLGISQPTAYRLMKSMAEHGLLGYDATAPGSFAAPHGIAVDSKNDIYVAEVTWTFAVSRGHAPADCHTFQKFALQP
jgi:DNA-binding IclR family transcriptional regulator